MLRASSAKAHAAAIVFAIASILNIPPILAKEPQKPIHQLRIYEIFDHNKQAFHDRFRDHAMRIMARHGFSIVATWEAKNGERTEFVYLIEWPNRDKMKASWAALRADQEWARIKQETAEAHGALLGDIQERTLELTDYSPRDVLVE